MTSCPTGQRDGPQPIKTSYLAILLLPVVISPLIARPAVYSVVGASDTEVLANRATRAGINTSADSWAGYPLLKRIASCESWGDPNKEPRQFTQDGQVLHGSPNPDD